MRRVSQPSSSAWTGGQQPALGVFLPTDVFGQCDKLSNREGFSTSRGAANVYPTGATA